MPVDSPTTAALAPFAASSMCYMALLAHEGRPLPSWRWKTVSFVARPACALTFLLAPPLQSSGIWRRLLLTAPGRMQAKK